MVALSVIVLNSLKSDNKAYWPVTVYKMVPYYMVKLKPAGDDSHHQDEMLC